MKKDNLIFIHKLFKAFADSIIKVFLPLYILKESQSLNLSMTYLIIFSLSVIIGMFIFKKFIQKYGIISIIIHFIPIIITMGIFSFYKVDLLSVIISAILMSLSQVFYSVPINLIFATIDKKTNVGKFEISTSIGKLIFTLISSYLLSSEIKNSFLILSIFSSLFYIISVIPLFFMYKELNNNYLKYKKNNVNKGKIKLDKWFIIFHILFGIFQPIMDNLLPLYLYINNLSFQAVTLMVVLVEALKILINYLSQFLVKKNKSIICIIISSLLFLISSILILIIKDSFWLYILSILCSISFPLTFVPMFNLYCKYLNKTNNVYNGMINRDIEIFSCRPSLYSLSFIGFSLYPCLIIGVIIIPFMFLSEVKIINDSNK